MNVIKRVGRSDREIAEFLKNPVSMVYVSEFEGNRIFEIEISSSKKGSICFYSEMIDIDEVDEIGVLGTRFGEIESKKASINPEFDMGIVRSIHKIIGDIDSENSCECGILIQFDLGIMTIMSGSFPTSLNLICPGFDQGLTVHSFQRLKYYISMLSDG